MRTIKGLLCAAALVVGVATSMAQSNVYSLNVVGYLNQTVQANHWYLWDNPLQAAGNDANSVLTNLNSAGGLADWGDATGAHQSTVFCYNQPSGNSGGFGASDTFYYDPADSFVQWAEGGNVDLTPGHGFWFFSTATGTVTFVGSVTTSNNWELVPGYNLVGSAYPAALSLTNLGLKGSAAVSQAQGGDYIFRWNLAPNYVNGFDAGITYWNDPVDNFVGWVTSDTGDTSGFEGPPLNPGEGIWYFKTTPGQVNWTQNFTIQ